MYSKVEPEVGATASIKPDSADLDNDVAFSKHVKSIMETPQDGLQRCLIPDEVVLEEFEVYFPDYFIPMWKKILFSILTCGAFACILLYRYCKRHRWCCLVPDKVHMVRGKMAVTNKGRAICWSMTADQVKKEGSFAFLASCYNKLCCCFAICTSCLAQCFCSDMCEPPFAFDVNIITREFLIKDVRQITQWYENENPCPAACSCCATFSEYQCGVDLSFHCFHNVSDFQGEFANPSSVATVSSITGWVQMVSAMSGYIAGSLASDPTSHTGVVRIISATSDLSNDANQSKPMNTVSALQERILSLIPPTPDSFFVDPALAEELKKDCSCKVVDDAHDIQIVDAGGNVQIPRKYVPLLPGESVIAGHGVVYIMTFMDWVKSICTLGYFYCVYVRRMKLSRTAVVLTTKRIVVVDIEQLGGRIPDSMMKFKVVIRSLFPRAIKAGYLQGYSSITVSEVLLSLCCSSLMLSFNEAQRVIASIMSDAGSFSVDLKQAGGGLAFAKALQGATSRATAKVDMVVSRSVDADTCVSDLEKTFIPLISTEKVLTRHAGYNKYQPCCDMGPRCAMLNNLLCSFQYGMQSTVYLCSRKALCCFPFVPMAFTCGLRPFLMKTDYVITDCTIYYVASKTSEPWIKCPLNENGFFVGSCLLFKKLII